MKNPDHTTPFTAQKCTQGKPQQPLVWIIDDDDSIRFVLSKALEAEGLEVLGFTNAQDAITAITESNRPQPALLISDIHMPGTSGLELLKTLKALTPALPIIIITAYSDLDSAVASFHQGAFEYLPKPFDLQDAIDLVHRALRSHSRQEPTTTPANPDPATGPKTHEMLGFAPSMQALFRTIGRLGQSQATVLITGESGSGKELVARALHKHSQLANGPFVAINTAAIAKDLLESELFGHERGAFTGAQGQRLGRFEQASGGILFLDEIGDMPRDLQTRLLRVLSEGQFYRVGGTHALQSKVRVIAATHQDLEKLVQQGHFRADLYHRLNVIRLRVPPLRERQEDIPLLATHFLQQATHSNRVSSKTLSQQALERLRAFGFPGNVRQLDNICHWLSIMAPGALIDVTDLPPEVLQSPVSCAPDARAPALTENPLTPSWQHSLAQTVSDMLEHNNTAIWETLLEECEKTLIQTALAHTQGRKIAAADKLGIGRNTMTRKIKNPGRKNR